MKKISIAFFAGMLFFAACDNPGSSTVGDWNKGESTEKSEQTEEHVTTKEHGSTNEENTGDTTKAMGDAEMGTDTSANGGESHPR